MSYFRNRGENTEREKKDKGSARTNAKERRRKKEQLSEKRGKKDLGTEGKTLHPNLGN